MPNVVTERLAINPEQWYHVAFTLNRNSGRIAMWVNNAVVREINDLDLANDLGSTDFVIGANATDTQHFHGLLDNVVLYERELSNDEVARLMDERDLSHYLRNGMNAFWSFVDAEGAGVDRGPHATPLARIATSVQPSSRSGRPAVHLAAAETAPLQADSPGLDAHHLSVGCWVRPYPDTPAAATLLAKEGVFALGMDAEGSVTFAAAGAEPAPLLPVPAKFKLERPLVGSLRVPSGNANASVELPDHAHLMMQHRFTLSVWFRADGDAGTVLAGLGLPAGVAVENGALVIDDASGRRLIHLAGVVSGRWHHLVIDDEGVYLDKRRALYALPPVWGSEPTLTLGNSLALDAPLGGNLRALALFRSRLPTYMVHELFDGWDAASVHSQVLVRYDFEDSAAPEKDSGPDGADLTLASATWSADTPPHSAYAVVPFTGPDGVVGAHFPFKNDAVNDASGKNQHAVSEGVAFEDSFNAVSDRAAVFDGASSVVRAPPAIMENIEQSTLSAWIKLPATLAPDTDYPLIGQFGRLMVWVHTDADAKPYTNVMLVPDTKLSVLSAVLSGQDLEVTIQMASLLIDREFDAAVMSRKIDLSDPADVALLQSAFVHQGTANAGESLETHTFTVSSVTDASGAALPLETVDNVYVYVRTRGLREIIYSPPRMVSTVMEQLDFAFKGVLQFNNTAGEGVYIKQLWDDVKHQTVPSSEYVLYPPPGDSFPWYFPEVPTEFDGGILYTVSWQYQLTELVFTGPPGEQFLVYATSLQHKVPEKLSGEWEYVKELPKKDDSRNNGWVIDTGPLYKRLMTTNETITLTEAGAGGAMGFTFVVMPTDVTSQASADEGSDSPVLVQTLPEVNIVDLGHGTAEDPPLLEGRSDESTANTARQVDIPRGDPYDDFFKMVNDAVDAVRHTVIANGDKIWYTAHHSNSGTKCFYTFSSNSHGGDPWISQCRFSGQTVFGKQMGSRGHGYAGAMLYELSPSAHAAPKMGLSKFEYRGRHNWSYSFNGDIHFFVRNSDTGLEDFSYFDTAHVASQPGDYGTFTHEFETRSPPTNAFLIVFEPYHNGAWNGILRMRLTLETPDPTYVAPARPPFVYFPSALPHAQGIDVLGTVTCESAPLAAHYAAAFAESYGARDLDDDALKALLADLPETTCFVGGAVDKGAVQLVQRTLTHALQPDGSAIAVDPETQYHLLLAALDDQGRLRVEHRSALFDRRVLQTTLPTTLFTYNYSMSAFTDLTDLDLAIEKKGLFLIDCTLNLTKTGEHNGHYTHQFEANISRSDDDGLTWEVLRNKAYVVSMAGSYYDTSSTVYFDGTTGNCYFLMQKPNDGKTLLRVSIKLYNSGHGNWGISAYGYIEKTTSHLRAIELSEGADAVNMRSNSNISNANTQQNIPITYTRPKEALVTDRRAFEATANGVIVKRPGRYLVMVNMLFNQDLVNGIHNRYYADFGVTKNGTMIPKSARYSGLERQCTAMPSIFFVDTLQEGDVLIPVFDRNTETQTVSTTLTLRADQTDFILINIDGEFEDVAQFVGTGRTELIINQSSSVDPSLVPLEDNPTMLPWALDPDVAHTAYEVDATDPTKVRITQSGEHTLMVNVSADPDEVPEGRAHWTWIQFQYGLYRNGKRVVRLGSTCGNDCLSMVIPAQTLSSGDVLQLGVYCTPDKTGGITDGGLLLTTHRTLIVLRGNGTGAGAPVPEPRGVLDKVDALEGKLVVAGKLRSGFAHADLTKYYVAAFQRDFALAADLASMSAADLLALVETHKATAAVHEGGALGFLDAAAIAAELTHALTDDAGALEAIVDSYLAHVYLLTVDAAGRIDTSVIHSNPRLLTIVRSHDVDWSAPTSHNITWSTNASGVAVALSGTGTRLATFGGGDAGDGVNGGKIRMWKRDANNDWAFDYVLSDGDAVVQGFTPKLWYHTNVLATAEFSADDSRMLVCVYLYGFADNASYGTTGLGGYVVTFDLDEAGRYQMVGSPVWSGVSMGMGSVRISGDGTHFVHTNYIASTTPSAAQVYRWDADNQSWRKLTSNLEELWTDYGSAYRKGAASVATNHSGSVVANMYISHGGETGFAVTVHRQAGNAWERFDNDAIKVTGRNCFGADMDMSVDGKTIVVSSFSSNANLSHPFKIDIFKFDDATQTWSSAYVIDYPNGGGAGAWTGYSVRCSADARYIISSGPAYSGARVGQVMAWQRETDGSYTEFHKHNVAVSFYDASSCISKDGLHIAYANRQDDNYHWSYNNRIIWTLSGVASTTPESLIGVVEGIVAPEPEVIDGAYRGDLHLDIAGYANGNVPNVGRSAVNSSYAVQGTSSLEVDPEFGPYIQMAQQAGSWIDLGTPSAPGETALLNPVPTDYTLFYAFRPNSVYSAAAGSDQILLQLYDLTNFYRLSATNVRLQIGSGTDKYQSFTINGGDMYKVVVSYKLSTGTFTVKWHNATTSTSDDREVVSAIAAFNQSHFQVNSDGAGNRADGQQLYTLKLYKAHLDDLLPVYYDFMGTA